MSDAITFAAQKAAEGKKVALVTVTETSGSSPASAGQMIAVLEDGTTAGTVGGGASEYRVIQRALEAVKNGERVFKFSFDHGELGMICGGGMAGFGSVLGGGPKLCLFGGGHISQCLARIACQSGFSVTVVEDRPEFARDFESARYVICRPEEYEKTDPASSCDYAVICTRGHKTDAEALRYCLAKKFEYLGMIGSANKVTEVFGRLRAEGAEQRELDRVYAPVGLDIADALPAEIAVAILAEILLVKNKGSLRHKKDS